jgi:hypothetical protein
MISQGRFLFHFYLKTTRILIVIHAFTGVAAFNCEAIRIREEKGEGIYSLWWYSTKIGLIDLKQGAIYVGKSF